jgi:protein-tyrosine phosphatase
MIAGARHLKLTGTFNARDAGGYPLAGHTMMRRGALLRSDKLARLDGTARQTLAAMGLRTIVDLREDEELDIAPDALDGLDVTVAHRPLFQGLAPDTHSIRAVHDMLVDRRGPALAAAVSALGRPGALPALVHCAAGKDRTGVVIALVQALVGVSDEDIAADYEHSAVYLNADYLATLARSRGGAPLTDEFVAMATTCPPGLIVATLTRVRQRHGSVEHYLLEHGCTQQELTTLRAGLVNDPKENS